MNPITPRQNQILKLLLKHRKSHSINKISEELGISRTAVLQHFATLEKMVTSLKANRIKPAVDPHVILL